MASEKGEGIADIFDLLVKDASKDKEEHDAKEGSDEPL